MALFGAKPEAEGKTGKLGKLVNRKNIVFLIVMHAVSFALIYLLCERFGEHELVLHGNVEIRQVELSFRVDGRIEKILVDEGMRVEKGELLARLESDIYKARLDAAKAAVDTQRAQLGKLEAGYRVEEVEQAREQVRSAKAQADYAKIQLDRITSMHRQNAISQQALDNALSLARQSLANLAAAEQARDMHERGYRKEDIENVRLVYHLVKEKGMTQKELADRLQITGNAVSKWERGVSCPDISVLPELAEILGVSMDELLAGNLMPDKWQAFKELTAADVKEMAVLLCRCVSVALAAGGLLIFLLGALAQSELCIILCVAVILLGVDSLLSY